jgi:hypothetical protein
MLDAAEREAEGYQRQMGIEHVARVAYRTKWVDACTENRRLQDLLDSAVVRGPGGRFVKV